MAEAEETTQWVTVLGCPLCDRKKNTLTETVNIAGAPIGSLEAHGITIPFSIAITYERCFYCGMVFQTPRLNDEACDLFYAPGGFYKEITPSRDNYKLETKRAERHLEIMKDLEVESVLDIGCGHGEFLQACQDEGWEVMGVDLDPEYAMEGLWVVDSLDYVGDTYDAVVMSHYLEHTVEPVRELQRAKLYSKKYIFVEVPRVDYDKRYLNIQHTLIFEPHVLVSTFERADLKVIGAGANNMAIWVVGERKNDS